MATGKEKSRIEQALSAVSLQSIISGFQNYKTTLLNVFQYRSRFVSILMSTESPDFFASAISTFLYGVAISFVIEIPLMYKHGLNIDKLHYLLQCVYLQCLNVLLIYFSAKIFRGQGTFQQTTAVYCIWIGVVSPIISLADYPFSVFFQSEDYIDINNIVNQVLILSAPPWVWIWNAVIFIIMIVLWFMLAFQWIANIHGITRRRMLIAMTVIDMPIRIAHNYIAAPYVSKVIRLVSNVLQKLI